MSPEELFQQIAEACPSFARQIAEHVSDNDLILPHLLMWDVRLFVESGFTGSTSLVVGPASEAEVRAVLDVLERAMASGDGAIENIVAVSFIEDLWNEPWFDRLAPLLGAALSAELERQRSWWASRE